MEDAKINNFEITLSKLRKVEFQQKAILDNIPDIAWLKDLQGKFIAVNEPFAKACGFKIEEIIGKTDLDIWPKELALSYRADDQEVIASKKRKVVQEKLMYQEGGEQWIETIKTPFFDEHGKVIGTTGIARNITMHKTETERLREIRAELELRVKVRTAELASSNEALRKEMRIVQNAHKELTVLGNFLANIFNSIQDGLCVLDKKMNIVRVNQTMEKWYAYNMPLVGKKCYQAYHQRDKPCEVCPVEETLKTHKPVCYVNPKEDKDGKIIGYFDLYSFPMFDEKTKEFVGVIEYVREITDQKNAEEALRVSEEKFRTIFEESSVGMIIADADTHEFILCNKAIQDVTGYVKDELLSLGLGIHPKESMPLVLDRFNQQAKGKRIVAENIPVKKKDGGILYFNITSTLLTIDGRKCVLGHFENVTESKKKSEEILQSFSLLKSTLDSSADGVLVVDLNGKIVSSNRRFSELWRIPEKLASTKNDNELLNFVLDQLVDPQTFVAKVRYLYSHPTEESFDTIIFKDGRVFDRLSIPQMIERQVVGRVWNFRDVTQNKRYESELKVYHEKLEVLVEQRTKSLELEIASRIEIEEKANELYRQLEFTLGATKTGLDIIDKDFNLCYVDPEWSRVYGDWEGKKCYEYFMDRKNACPTCAIEEAFRTKKTVVSEEVLPKEGNRVIQVTTIPYQDKHGNWLVAEVNVDITQKKKVDEELRRYREELEELVGERTRDLLQETNRYKAAELEKSKLNRELIKTNEKLKSISLIDAHTGLFNYRYLQEAIEVEFHQARRYAQNLTIIMLDVDYFKSINDVYGIAFGDLVLKQLAKQLKRMVRRYDILIRYSGEEFIVISPRLNRNTAFNMAQRLLDSLNFINFGNKQHSVKLKISLSVVSFPEDRAKSGMDLVNVADVLLNKAKESGGNRVFSSLDAEKLTGKGEGRDTRSVGIKTLKSRIDKLNKQSKQGLSESIFAFAKTLELKDHYTGEHVENTVYFATAVAKELNLSKEDVELIKQAAMLHDLGKIGISENILLKKGKLTKKEFVEIKRHPQIGADIIRPIQFLHDLIPFIFYHHERWDGKGYPSGIKGEDIPLGARVIAIADVYQALISDRPYHKAFPKHTAVEIIKKSSGSQFDPRIVSAFLKVVSREK
jgi:diguanylate cyclase (GGDEF)-like protein/PAS domain S-box-containing protein/putative nucleotidyltransferase with HDIG domain